VWGAQAGAQWRRPGSEKWQLSPGLPATGMAAGFSALLSFGWTMVTFLGPLPQGCKVWYAGILMLKIEYFMSNQIRTNNK
jgi:hypothetical protein